MDSFIIFTRKVTVPPVSGKIIKRSRLYDLLDGDESHYNLIILSASAGFGKTSLLCSWLQTQRSAAAWFSIDKDDNDPNGFFRYFIQSLRLALKNNSHMGRNVEMLLESSESCPVKLIFSSLISEIDLCDRKITIVLDNFHEIVNRELLDGVAFLLDHQPENLKIVISGRTDQNLHVAKSRLSGKTLVISTGELKFDFEEAGELIRSMKLNVSEKERSSLLRLTEGWITALNLILENIRKGRGIDEFLNIDFKAPPLLIEYLLEEVLAGENEETVYFLLHTSPLAVFNADLCRFILSEKADLNEKSLNELILQLFKSNVFLISVDGDQRWFRYHRQFQQFLIDRLKRVYPEDYETILGKASLWHEENGKPYEAIDYAIEGNEHARAADLIENFIGRDLIHLYEHGKQTQLSRWIDSLPEQIIRSKPHLASLSAWMNFITGKFLKAQEELDRISMNGDDRVEGRLHSIRSFIFSSNGKYEQAINEGQTALETLHKEDRGWHCSVMLALKEDYLASGDLETSDRMRDEAIVMSKAAGENYIYIIMNLSLAESHRQQGALELILSLCDQLQARIEQTGLMNSPLHGWLLAVKGETLFEMDREGGLELVKRSIDLTEQNNDLFFKLKSKLPLLRISFSLGLYDELLEDIRKLELDSHTVDIPVWAVNELHYWKGRALFAQNRFRLAKELFDGIHRKDHQEINYSTEKVFLNFARCLVMTGEIAMALDILRDIFRYAELNGRIPVSIESGLLTSIALMKQGDLQSAVSHFSDSVDLAGDRGFIRLIADEVPAIIPLLHEEKKRNRTFVERIINTVPATSDYKRILMDKGEYLETLSKREIEILQMIADGLNNQNIADKAYLSLHTVKTHTRNIYGKLQVHHRAEAVAKARELGIL